MLKFLKSRPKFKVRTQQKGPVIRNTHMKYESPITYHSKDMANAKVSADRQKNRQAKNYMPQSFDAVA
jgi:hypothetical protein